MKNHKPIVFLDEYEKGSKKVKNYQEFSFDFSPSVNAILYWRGGTIWQGNYWDLNCVTICLGHCREENKPNFTRDRFLKRRNKKIKW